MFVHGGEMHVGFTWHSAQRTSF